MEKLPTCHIVLATDSPVPVLAPLLETGAQEAVLVCTDYTEPFALRQAQTLEKRGVKTRLEKFKDVFHLEPILQEANALVGRHPDGVCVNLTGGSKLMSIAFYQIFNRPQNHLYYVHLHNNSLVWLQGGSDTPIKSPLSLSELLFCRGYEIAEYKTRVDFPQSWTNLAFGLCSGRDQVGMGVLSRELHSGKKTIHPSTGVAAFFQKLEQLGLLTPAKNRAGYVQPVAPQRSFLISEWLELGIYEIVRRLAQKYPAISEVVMGVKIHNPKNRAVDPVTGNSQPLQNELDVVAVCNNTLYLIECKNTDKVSQQMVGKLDVIRDTIGDIKAKAMLLSRGEMGEAAKQRAREYGIDTLEWKDFDRLEERLIEWMGLDKKDLSA